MSRVIVVGDRVIVEALRADPPGDVEFVATTLRPVDEDSGPWEMLAYVGDDVDLETAFSPATALVLETTTDLETRWAGLIARVESGESPESDVIA
jgi:hypothetical protein